MATIYTHAVVGLGLARLYATRPMPWLYWGLAAFLPIIPDLDSFSGYTYGSPWGHRGITHSFVFALWLGFFTASLTFRYFKANLWGLTLLFFAVTASHGVLDALTRGGASIPFFWPADARYGNWGPIPVADIGFEWPDPRTSRAVRAELLRVWLPTAVLAGGVMAYRGWRRRRKATD